MSQTFEAIYANGVFKPLEPLQPISENRRVKLTVEVDNPKSAIHECIGIMPDSDASEMKRIIEEEFEKVDVNEWK